jgi:hypothetical protein
MCLTVMDVALNFSTGTKHHYAISSRIYLRFDTLVLGANPAFSTSRTSNPTYTTYKLKVTPGDRFLE